MEIRVRRSRHSEEVLRQILQNYRQNWSVEGRESSRGRCSRHERVPERQRGEATQLRSSTTSLPAFGCHSTAIQRQRRKYNCTSMSMRTRTVYFSSPTDPIDRTIVGHEIALYSLVRGPARWSAQGPGVRQRD